MAVCGPTCVLVCHVPMLLAYSTQACLKLAEQCLTLAAEEEMTAALQEGLTTYATGPAGSSSMQPSSSEADTAAPVAAEPAIYPLPVRGGSSSSDPADTHAAEEASTDPQQETLNETDDATAVATTPTPPAAAAAAPAPAAWDATNYAAACAACRSRAAQHQQDASALYDSIQALVDAATAHVLHVSTPGYSCAMLCWAGCLPLAMCWLVTTGKMLVRSPAAEKADLADTKCSFSSRACSGVLFPNLSLSFCCAAC